MNILILGEKERSDELLKLLNNNCSEHKCTVNNESEFDNFDIVFDLNFDTDQKHLEVYIGLKNKIIFLSSVQLQLADAFASTKQTTTNTFIGINALPTFIDRSRLELSLLAESQNKALTKIMQTLHTDYTLVSDRVAMVTPRVICMIINEACYTLQEGTANIKDIDLGMKLGTNYPHGPFEWCDKIGIKNVYETLLAVYEDTKDERYKICPLLKTKYLKQESFY